MYVIDLLSTVGTSVEESLPVPIVTVRGWSKRINAPGKFVFSIHRNHPSATDENLRMWRHVRLFRQPRDGTDEMRSAWYGIMLSKRQVGDRIEVLCHGALTILDKRDVSGTFTGGGSDEAFTLLEATNADDGPTGISTGADGVATTMDVTLTGVKLSRALDEFAAATGGEYEVDDDAELNFVPSLGEDKSDIIELIFQTNGDPGSNVTSFEVAEDGEPMANKIIGTSSASGGLTSEYTHPTSSDTYPVLVERKAFNHANDQATLDALTEAFGLQRAFPIPDFQAVPATATKKFNPLTGEREIAGLQYEDVSVGDLVLVTIITPNRNESVVKRILELIVDVDENLNEQLRFTLGEAGVFVTEQYLSDATLPDIKRRLQEIEASL